ncbi:MAG: UbiD family decarboxylase [Chloroflexi bacterium]|nr:UbiD family decarboxylase [Chloroflexota bacterium]
MGPRNSVRRVATPQPPPRSPAGRTARGWARAANSGHLPPCACARTVGPACACAGASGGSWMIPTVRNVDSGESGTRGQSRDMRSWIAELEAAHELIRVDKPVDPLTEMGALLYQCRERALLFESLPHGWRALAQAPANVRQAALAFGAREDTVVPLVAERMGARIAPIIVADGPVKEIKRSGGTFDLGELPVHIAGQRDGGPVIGSGLVVTKDPDTGQRNVSFHRLQIKGPNQSGILLYPRHAWRNYLKYEARNEPMPVAVFIGHHPLYYAAASTTAAYGVDEFEIAGGFLGHPVRLVRCETVDLEVPADAEIVLEGHIPPHIREEEGPFSEFQDYYVTGAGKNPVVEYQYMTRRHDAIFKNLQNGSEMEGCVFHKIPMSATIYRRLKDVGGGPNLHNVMALPGIFGLAIQMTPRYYGEAKNLLMAALSSEYQHPKVAIAVDADVDIFNPAELLWALSTRVNPQQDVVIIPETHNHAMDAALPELGAPGTALWQRLGSKMLIDATIPPPADAPARALFERIRPRNPHLRLEDFAAEESLPLVRALPERYFGSRLLE